MYLARRALTRCPSNLNGTAVYMPMVCDFMAKVDGYEDKLTPSHYAVLNLVGAITSIGDAAALHAGLVMVVTVWRTVFGINVPPSFARLVGTVWTLARLRSVVNVTNDTVTVRILVAQCSESVADGAAAAPVRVPNSLKGGQG